MAGIDFLAQSLRNLLSVSEVMWSCNEAKRDLRRARRKCQQQAKMNLWHELESLRQYTWHLEWAIHNLEQQLAQSQGADSESEQSLAQLLLTTVLVLSLLHVERLRILQVTTFARLRILQNYSIWSSYEATATANCSTCGV